MRHRSVGLKIVRLAKPRQPSAEGNAEPESETGPSRPVFEEADGPSLTGPLGGSAGPKLLLELFLGERSGRLVVEGMPGPLGALYFFAGEPVHVAAADGAALERRLAARGPLKAPSPPRPGMGKNLFAALSRRSNPVAVLEALREEVREFSRALLSAQAGAWAFFDGERFAASTPLTAVNPFGLVLEARRRATPPEALMRLSGEMGALYAVPQLGFADATSRLRAFTSHADLADVVDGTRTVADVCARLGLDPLMGGLVLRTLADTGVMRLLHAPPPASEVDRRRQKANAQRAALVQADAQQLSQLAALPGKGGAEILSLYLDIKPETDPAAVLGIEGSAGPAMIERCYQQRLAELDPRAIPPGPNRPYLLSRVEELRPKVEQAYLSRMPPRARGAAAAYEILDRVGVGGMAEVFRGRATDDPTKLVAIKCILPELRADGSFSQMFLEEARLARRVQHPNVVRIYTVGKSTDDLYLAMEYVDGLDFGDLVKRGRQQSMPVSVDIVCRVVAEACAGLHAAHTARDRLGNPTPILHRDVSPQNILVSRMGDVKLSDFGIARAMDSHEEDSKSVKGKIPFLAPEVLRGKPASERSDIYAMAMTVYAALARTPFSRKDTYETMSAILHDPLPPLSTMAPEAGVPEALDRLIMRAAAKDPEERPVSAQELQLELEELLATRPPVDVAGWARPLCGKRIDPVTGKPITSASSPRPITSKLTPRPITSSHTPRPITTTTDARPITTSASRIPAPLDLGPAPPAPQGATKKIVRVDDDDGFDVDV